VDLKKIVPAVQIGAYIVGGYLVYRFLRTSTTKLADVGTAASSSLIDYFRSPGGTANTAAQLTSEYDKAVAAIVKANPQFTERYVKRLLVNKQWHLGDPMPAGSGLNTPPGM